MLQDYSRDIFDIIIQGGQSNSYGCGIGPVEKPYEPRGDILMMDGYFNIKIAEEEVWDGDSVGNLAHRFAERYINDGLLASGRKILILKSSEGGTGFYDKRWGPEDDLFLRMLDMIGKSACLNKENRFVAFLWHQGETDTADPDRDKHNKNLSALVGRTRQAAGFDDLPFIAGDFVSQWKMKNLTVCEPIVSAIRDVCKNTGHSGFVETDGLTSNDEVLGNGDDIHFSREALYSLGDRYYDAFHRIRSNIE